MKNIIFIFLILFSFHPLFSQNTDKAFRQTYQRLQSKRFVNINKSDPEKFKLDSVEIVEVDQLLNVLNGFMTQEHAMNGRAGFAFSGNQSDLNNIFKIGSMEI